MSKFLRSFLNPNAHSLFKLLTVRAMSEAVMPEPLVTPDDDGKKRHLHEDNAEESDAKKLKVDNDVAIKIKRRKVALMLSYCGTGYFGMQRNKGTKTIEEDLMEAFLKAGLISEENFEVIQSIGFQRAARTDKGVSAARQVVSLRLPETASVEQINEHLPEQIRVMAIKRVTKGFDAKNSCDGRTYSYMLPTFAFTPKDEEIKESYRMSSEVLSRINDILLLYKGTHNYHNFTSGKKPLDPSAKRFIINFVCETPFLRGDVEYTVLKVKGQSFMLHQIRKMIGLTIAVLRGYIPIEIFNEIFEEDHIDIPKAPGLGLMLEQVHYTRYNARYGADGIHESLDWLDVDDLVNEFKSKYILSHIVDVENKEKSTLDWIMTVLPYHNFSQTLEGDGPEFNEHNGDDG